MVRSFGLIGFHSDISKERLSVFINGEASRIIVIVAVIIIPGFYSQTETAVSCNKKAGTGIENIFFSVLQPEG